MKKKSKKMPKGIPKPGTPDTPKDSPEEARRRLIRSIVPEIVAPVPDSAAESDIDLDAPLESRPTVEPTAEPGETEGLGPWRQKQLAPLIKQYMGGVRKMWANRLMQDRGEIEEFSLGLDMVYDSAMGVGDILARKYLGEIPYAEEGFAAITVITLWGGSRKLEHGLKANRAPGAGRAGKDDNPPAPPPDPS